MGFCIISMVVFLLFYFMPILAAAGKKNTSGVIALNLLFGWTIIGWIVALVWAITLPEKDSKDIKDLNFLKKKKEEYDLGLISLYEYEKYKEEYVLNSEQEKNENDYYFHK